LSRAGIPRILLDSSVRVIRFVVTWRSHCSLMLALGVLAGLLSMPVATLASAPERLVVTHSASWTPYAYLNAEGEPAGMLVDLWRLFGEKNNVEISFKLVDWHDTFDLLRRGEAEVHGGLTSSDARDTFLDFSREVLRIPTLLFVPSGQEDQDLADMGNQVVGVVDSTFDHDFVETHFPEVNLRTYANSRAMVESAIRGELQAFIADYPSGYYRLLLIDAIDKFRAVDTLYTESIHVAVPQGSSELLSFLDQGFAKVTEADKNALRVRWLIPAEPMPQWLLPGVIAVVVLVCLIAFGAHYLHLRQIVGRRTEDLNASIRKLESANTELGRLARIDPLTGVANRQSFYDKATREIERARRYDHPVSLAMFDLDHFKQVNDRFGHIAGDTVLKHFATVVGRELRESDVFARLGGDEFIALLPETDRDTAMVLAKRILGKLRDRRFDVGDDQIDLSFSAGVAAFEDDGSIDEWIERADRGLYKSKSEGRSRVSEGQTRK
jgi:diguanylate cyclase (GGDEF)-like protein